MQTLHSTSQHWVPGSLDPAACQVFLAAMPENIRAALLLRAAEIEYPIEAVLEMAIAGFLDMEAMGFVDCKPGRS
jgi:hypothetical protein